MFAYPIITLSLLICHDGNPRQLTSEDGEPPSHDGYMIAIETADRVAKVGSERRNRDDRATWRKFRVISSDDDDAVV
jgi:hypothetical protein